MEKMSYKNLKQFARVSGFLYLIVIGAGLFAEAFVRQKMMIPHDALATANKIQANEMLYRLGFSADLVNFICGLPVILFFWVLFRQSRKYVVTLAIFFAIISNAVFATNILNQLHPLLIFGNADYLQAFQPAQLAVLGKVALNLQGQGYAIGLVFFGFYCIIIGYLILKTRFIPKFLGGLYALAGFCYILHSFIMFLSRGFDDPLFPYVLFPCFIGELLVALYLLIMGVKESGMEESINETA